MTINELTPNQARVLADRHIRKFQAMLSSGSRFVNASECKAYLNIWHGTREKAEQDHWVDLLTAQERREVIDALGDGSFDDLLRAAGPS